MKIQSQLAILLIAVPSAFASEEVGKIAQIRGKVFRVTERKSQELKAEDPLYQNDVLRSNDGSGAKIILNDKSIVVLGAASTVILEYNGGSSPFSMRLVSGQLRSQIVKKTGADLKPKFMIRTRSATMGVRGTDFEAVYNPKTSMTSLLTYEGTVAMAKSTDATTPAQALAVIQDPSKTVLCHQGQFSGTALTLSQPTLPVRISPAQLQSLRNANDKPNLTASNTSANGKIVVSPVPPGVDSKALMGSVSDVKDAMTKTTGNTAPVMASASILNTVPPEGINDSKTGRIAPPAGGLVDLKTGLYVPPPPGSPFDPVAQVYVPTPSVGTFRSDTGAYVPPAGYALDPVKGFVSTTGGATSGSAPATGSPAPFGLTSGGTMVAAAPAPGAGPASFGTPVPPPATTVTSLTGTSAGGTTTASPSQYYNGSQPTYPVYDPSSSVCPPYCSPSSQPGSPGSKPTSTAPATTSVTFTIN